MRASAHVVTPISPASVFSDRIHMETGFGLVRYMAVAMAKLIAPSRIAAPIVCGSHRYNLCLLVSVWSASGFVHVIERCRGLIELTLVFVAIQVIPSVVEWLMNHLVVEARIDRFDVASDRS